MEEVDQGRRCQIYSSKLSGTACSRRRRRLLSSLAQTKDHRAVASRQNWDSCNSQLLLQGESIPEPILFKDIISLHNNALDCQIVENLWWKFFEIENVGYWCINWKLYIGNMAIYESDCSEMKKNRIPEKRVGNSQFLWKRAQRVDSSTLNSWITTALMRTIFCCPGAGEYSKHC